MENPTTIENIISNIKKKITTDGILESLKQNYTSKDEELIEIIRDIVENEAQDYLLEENEIKKIEMEILEFICPNTDSDVNTLTEKYLLKQIASKEQNDFPD